MLDIELNTLQEYLGQQGKIQGREVVFACNKCRENGLDSRGDNLKFHLDKKILYCFSNPYHSREILKDIAKIYGYKTNNRHENIIAYDKYAKVLKPSKQAEFQSYMEKCNEELLATVPALEYLEEKRGINKKTVESTFIGVDIIKKRWVIPNFKYNTNGKNEIINFEYRNLGFQKDSIRKEKGCPNGLVQINKYTDKTNKLVVLEGPYDSLVFYQYLTEIEKIEDYHIVTTSNGVNSLLNYISDINFTKYEKFNLYIDNDEVSRPIASEIISRYPFFNDIVPNCNCKDFNQHYLECIKAKRQ